MSFDGHDGTRGGRQPGGRFMLWGNRFAARRIARKGKVPGLGFDALILVTVGRTTGQERRSPVGWFPGDNGSWLIVAAAAGGPKNPMWYYNLAANPDRVRIELPGKTVNVTADQLHGDERARAWQQITTAAPRFATYEEKTDRVLPVIRLVPKSQDGGENGEGAAPSR
jgi:deazaflavin-dependent oxidoreductase (nitroreductase family)